MNPALQTLLQAFDFESLPAPETALFLRAEPHTDLRKWPSITGWQPSKPQAIACENQGLELTDTIEGRYDAVLVLPAKDRDETLVLLARAFTHLTDHGQVFVAMPNRAGAGRYEKELARHCGEISRFSKNKCRAFWTAPGTRPPQDVLDEWLARGARHTIPGTNFAVEAGIYGAGKIDDGSALLASHLPKRLRGQVADLGSGWGYLTHALLQTCRGVVNVDLYEADRRALDCSRANTDPGKCRYHWADVTSGLPTDHYDAVIMNPPFHSGIAQDIGLGERFIGAAAEALKPRGELWMVANTHLPYEATLDAQEMTWKIIEQTPSFKVIAARKPAR